MNKQQQRENKAKAALSIKKAQGTTAKVLEMIGQDTYCPEIIQQIDATIGLLNASKKRLLKGHLAHCLERNLKENKLRAIDELIQIFDLK